MRLKARIKQIEAQIKIDGSPFCACESHNGKVYPRYEIVFEKDGIQRTEKPIADFCDQCQKLIEKRQIIICFV